MWKIETRYVHGHEWEQNTQRLGPVNLAFGLFCFSHLLPSIGVLESFQHMHTHPPTHHTPHTSTHTHTYTHPHPHTYIYTHTHIPTHTHQTHPHTPTHTHTCVRTHTHTHTYTIPNHHYVTDLTDLSDFCSFSLMTTATTVVPAQSESNHFLSQHFWSNFTGGRSFWDLFCTVGYLHNLVLFTHLKWQCCQLFSYSWGFILCPWCAHQNAAGDKSAGRLNDFSHIHLSVWRTRKQDGIFSWKTESEAVSGQLQYDIHPLVSSPWGGRSWPPKGVVTSSPPLVYPWGWGWVGGFMFSKRCCDIQNFSEQQKWPPSLQLLGAQTINGLRTIIETSKHCVSELFFVVVAAWNFPLVRKVFPVHMTRPGNKTQEKVTVLSVKRCVKENRNLMFSVKKKTLCFLVCGLRKRKRVLYVKNILCPKHIFNVRFQEQSLVTQNAHFYKKKLECLVALCRALLHPQLIEEKFWVKNNLEWIKNEHSGWHGQPDRQTDIAECK